MYLFFFTLSYIFVQIFVGGFFRILTKLTKVFLLRLRTRYLSVKSPVWFDFCGLFYIKLWNFRVFRNIKLHFFFIFPIFLYCGTTYLTMKSPFRF